MEFHVTVTSVLLISSCCSFNTFERVKLATKLNVLTMFQHYIINIRKSRDVSEMSETRCILDNRYGGLSRPLLPFFPRLVLLISRIEIYSTWCTLN